MKILQVNKLYYPHIGGIERVVQAIAEHLVETDHEVRVLAAKCQGFGEQEIINGVRVTKTTSLGDLLSVPVAPLYPARFVTHVRDADIFHHHLPNPLGVVSHQLHAPDETPSVISYHSDIVRQSGALKLYAPLLKRQLARADRILVASPQLLSSSPFLTPHADKCHIVPYSVDLAKIDGYADADLDIEPELDEPVILFVGRLVYYKGVEYLIKAMDAVDATLLVVGDGDDRAELERQVDSLGLSDRVRFLGHVSDETLHACYERADVFALPSVEPSEAFAIVQIEAMAHGTPVVNTSLPTGVPWVSQDGLTGRTVEPRDSDALADALDDILSNPDQRATYAANARERVESEFSRELMLERITDVYCNVANR
jgi:rhamnosyl/mannosyltransferase